jgi:Flp pilus assembly protein TadB
MNRLDNLSEYFQHGTSVRKLSADYLEFIREEVEKKSFYENICSLASTIIKIEPGKDKAKELQQKLDFSNLKISASDVYSAFVLMIILTIFVDAASFISLMSLNYEVGEAVRYIFGVSIAGFVLAYYILLYPSIYAKKVRVEASAEIVQTILYISIGLKNVPNLESAVAFAAFNLDGPIGKDLRKLLWDIYTGKYSRIEDALDDFSNKWKFENREFSQALDLLKTSITDVYNRDQVIDRAVALILQSNMERMNEYARELKNPITMINALGILLPVITLILFPILGLIMPSLISPYTLLTLYNIILPVTVFWLMKNTLDKRPYAFHAIDIKNHPEASGFGSFSFKLGKRKLQVPLLPFCFLIFLLIAFPAITGILNVSKDTSLSVRTFYGLQVFWGLIVSIIIFTLLSTNKNNKIKKDLEEMETEFAEAIFILGSTLRAGQPLEMSLRKTSERVKDQKIYSFFEKIINTMNTLGVTLREAVFNKDFGVIKHYPSKTIKNTMKIVVDSSSKGLYVTASTLSAISQYMKNVHEVDEHLKQLLEDVTSSMGLMSSLLVPLAAGVVVGLGGIIMKILLFVSTIFNQLPIDQQEVPIIGTKIEAIMPIEMMIIIVGVYMVELIISINIFKVQIERGNDLIEIGYSIGMNLLSGALIFTLAVVIIQFGLGALIPLSV